MKSEKENSFTEHNSSKFSLMKDLNKTGKLNLSYKSNASERGQRIPFKLNNNKTLFANNIGFVPHFGKGILKKNNEKINSNINNRLTINNSYYNNTNNNFNSYELNSSESLEEEKNLKHVEKEIKKEIKNKLLDMTIINTENKSFAMENKMKGMEAFSVEIHRKKKKKKKKGNKNKNKNKSVMSSSKRMKNMCKDMYKDRKVVRKPPLYDSLDEEEMQEDDNDDYCFINPEGNFILVLDTIMFITSFISFLYTPIQIAQSKCFCIEEHLITQIIFNLIDLIFIFDLIISFFRGFYNYEYKIIKHIKIIVKNYLTTNFFFDFIESIPFNIIINYICLNKEKYKPDGDVCLYNGINGLYASIKILSSLKSFKVLKVMNKNKNRAYQYLEEIDNIAFEQLKSIFSFFILMFGSINAFICIHIFIGNQSYPNWLVSMEIKDSPFIQIYIAALYGIIETLTTVGYGDVVVNSFTEICFQIVLLSVGIVAYSWIITIIGNYVKNESKAEIKHSKDLTTLEEIRIDYPKMSFKLYNKIHQHLKSVSNQQKKIDLNILVNSLPYSIKNMVLFKIYGTYIKKFNFFRKCDNTDFISRVLTNFIPLFSRKKALLIHEGEVIENLFFVKMGKLSLDAALDRDDPEESISKYLYEKFDDLIEKDKTDNQTNNDIKESINPQHLDKVKNGIQNIFNNQKKSITAGSFHESGIEKEVGKCDLGGSEDFEERNCQFLRILYIKRNENFGLTYMLLNKPCPLSLRVNSKKADIFILRKHDVINISKAYPTIWKIIFDRALYNMIAIKNKTFKTLKNYCSYHGIVVDKNIKKNTDKIYPLNLSEIKEIIESEKQKLKDQNKKKRTTIKKKHYNTEIIKEEEIIANIKTKLINKHFNKSKSLSPFLTKIEKKNKQSCKFLFKNAILEQKSYMGTLKCTTFKLSNKKGIKEDNNSSCSDTIKEESNKNDIQSYNIEKEKENEKEKEKENEKEKEKGNINDFHTSRDTDKLYMNERDKNYPNTLNNLSPYFSTFLKKKIIKKKNKNKNYYKKLCLKLTEALNNITKENIIKNEDNNNPQTSNYNPSLFENNNYLISHSNFIFPITEKFKNNYDLISSTTSKATSNNSFDIGKLSIDNNISFHYNSRYRNLNIISDGAYEKDTRMQKETEQFIKSFQQAAIRGVKTILKKDSNLKSKTPIIQKKTKKDISFSLSLGNISEIKSNSSYKDSIASPLKQIKKADNSPKKILKKEGDSKKTNKKRKKIKFSIPPESNLKIDIHNTEINKDAIITSNNNNNKNSLVAQSEKDPIKLSSKKIFNYDDKKAKTFINKMFSKKETGKEKEKENNNKSQSNEFLCDFNILNQNNGLRNSNNLEELKNKTLQKLNSINNEENSKKEREDSNNNKHLEDKDKTNDNCIIL